MCNAEPVHTTLWHLPPEDVIYKSIFSRLDIKELSVLSNTCSAYRDMVRTYFQTMRIVDLGIYGRKISERALTIVLSKNSNCEKLVLRDCKSSLVDKILQPMVQRNPLLLHIDLTNCTSLSNSSLQALAVNCTQLTRLCLSGCVWATPEAVTNIGLHCRNLEHLDLSGCWNINDDCVSTITSTCSK